MIFILSSHSPVTHLMHYYILQGRQWFIKGILLLCRIRPAEWKNIHWYGLFVLSFFLQLSFICFFPLSSLASHLEFWAFISCCLESLFKTKLMEMITLFYLLVQYLQGFIHTLLWYEWDYKRIWKDLKAPSLTCGGNYEKVWSNAPLVLKTQWRSIFQKLKGFWSWKLLYYI